MPDIDFGDNPIGTPPTSTQVEQIKDILTIDSGDIVDSTEVGRSILTAGSYSSVLESLSGVPTSRTISGVSLSNNISISQFSQMVETSVGVMSGGQIDNIVDSLSVISYNPQTIAETQRKVAKANVSIVRESVLPGLRTWAARPLAGLSYAVVSDSTSHPVGAWPRQFAQLIASANPEHQVREHKYLFTPETITHTLLQAGTERKVFWNGVSTAPVFSSSHPNGAVTGDVDVRVKFSVADITASNYIFVAHLGIAIRIVSGIPRFYWSPTNAALETSMDSTKTLAQLGFVNNVSGWLRMVLDVDNGSGGKTLTVYNSSDDGLTWALQATVPSPGTTSIGANWNGIVYLGSPAEVGLSSTTWSHVEWRDGIDGWIKSPLSIDHYVPNFLNRIGYSGNANLDSYIAGNDGAIHADWTLARLKKAIPMGVNVVIISLGHNELSIYYNDYQTVYNRIATLIADLKTVSPNASIVIASQNPIATTDPRYIRQSQLISNTAQAAKALGLPYLDIFGMMMERGFENSWLFDNFHPTGETYALWAQLVYDAVFTRVAE